MLKNLQHEAPRSESLMRVYDKFIVFNAAAARLLGLTEGSYVTIMQDDRDNDLYVANAPGMRQSHAVRKRNNTFKLNSASFCRDVASALEGPGTYRICPETTKDEYGRKFFNIFKKKYGNQ